MNTENKLLLRPEEVAGLLGIGRSRVYEELAAGRLRSVTIGRSRRIPRAAVDDFVALVVAEQDIDPDINNGVPDFDDAA